MRVCVHACVRTNSASKQRGRGEKDRGWGGYFLSVSCFPIMSGASAGVNFCTAVKDDFLLLSLVFDFSVSRWNKIDLSWRGKVFWMWESSK